VSYHNLVEVMRLWATRSPFWVGRARVGTGVVNRIYISVTGRNLMRRVFAYLAFASVVGFSGCARKEEAEPAKQADAATPGQGVR
jgi:hypothetical protein